MSYILNIETATKNCSVALALEGKTIAHREISEEGYSHAERLHVFIEEVIQEAGIRFQDLKAIAVSQGPGSYTGLRIGVSTAKGLCFALDLPLIAIDTLKSFAAQVTQKDGLIVPMLDARRMEVYSAIFDSNLEIIRGIEAEVITPESFSELKEKVYFIGDCAQKCQEVLQKENFVFLTSVVYPSAKEMSVLSYEKLLQKDCVDLAYFEPFYLKDFMVTTPKSKG